MLSPEESRRYARHLVLRQIGAAGQHKLAAARVLVVGAGGLGCPALAYLAAAGVGTLAVADPDAVDISNLQRQILFREGDLGLAKAVSACEAIGRINPHVRAIPRQLRVDRDNADELVRDHDLVLEGTDCFETRRVVAAACERHEIPLVTGAVAQLDGALTTLLPYASDRDGRPNPRFSCLYPTAPAPGEVPMCEEAGVLNVLPGIVGTMMANEALKLVAGFGEPLVGKLLVYSARTGETRIMRYARRSDEAAS